MNRENMTSATSVVMVGSKSKSSLPGHGIAVSERCGQVTQQLARLESVLIDIGNEVAALEEKLVQVLHATNPQLGASSSGEQEERVPLALRIEGYNSTACEIRDRLQCLLARIDV